MKTKNLCIMFTDIKGFTEKSATKSRQQLEFFLKLQDKVIKPVFAEFDGKIIKTIGDAFLVVFDSPTDAVLCGMRLQESVINHNARAASDDRFEIRVAINLGEVYLKDNDIFGEPVNIASRIESIAEPNEVYFTEAVFLAMNKNEIPTAEIGYRYLKGIPEKVKVYKVVLENTKLIEIQKARQAMAQKAGELPKGEMAEEIPKATAQPQVQETLDEQYYHPYSYQYQKMPQSFWQKYKWLFIVLGVILAFIILIVFIRQTKVENLREQKVKELQVKSKAVK